MVKVKRINKYISDSGLCSRREADKLVEEGRVLVNGKAPEVGAKIGPEDKVTVDRLIVSVRESDKSDGSALKKKVEDLDEKVRKLEEHLQKLAARVEPAEADD